MGETRILRKLTRDLDQRVERLEPPEDLLARFGPYRDHPVRFVTEVLGAKLEPYQLEILESCVTDPRVAWRAAHGTGKTAVLAWVLLWWLLTRPFSRVLILAPAYERQIGRYLLPEVKKWVRRAPQALPVLVRSARQWTHRIGRSTDAHRRGQTRRPSANLTG